MPASKKKKKKKSPAKKAAEAAVSAAAPVPVPRQPQEIDGVNVIEVRHEGGIADGGAVAGGKLRVILESNSVEKLLLPTARKLAYIQRLDYGMHHAGVESDGGTYVTDEELSNARVDDRDVRVWRIDFIITPML
jgi:hypothetical protein